jgi:outer membrane protein assembly factor BamE (lipoprotein component of BamABCDE complex)
MRNWNKGRLFVLLGAITVVLLAFCAVFGAPWGAADVSHSITDESLKSLSPGMTMAEVREALGTPLAQETNYEDISVWRYSRPVKHVRWYPEVALLFRKGKLAEAFVKRRTFWGVDGELRYWMKQTGERWSTPGFSTDKW